MYVTVTITVPLRRIAVIMRAMKFKHCLIVFGGNKIVRMDGTILAIVRDGFVPATRTAYAAIIMRGAAERFANQRRVTGQLVKLAHRLVRKISFYHAVMNMVFMRVVKMPVMNVVGMTIMFDFRVTAPVAVRMGVLVSVYFVLTS